MTTGKATNIWHKFTTFLFSIYFIWFYGTVVWLKHRRPFISSTHHGLLGDNYSHDTLYNFPVYAHRYISARWLEQPRRLPRQTNGGYRLSTHASQNLWLDILYHRLIARGVLISGLVTVLGGTMISHGATTIHETKVIGTYIQGKYAQILESTSRVIQPSAVGVSPSPTFASQGHSTAPPGLQVSFHQMECKCSCRCFEHFGNFRDGRKIRRLKIRVFTCKQCTAW